ncbi:MAG: hypothetical protein HGA45_14220 [Chloroflexales bacterium]|nr:hypothetical protein [Chloroflexales bacterium]
MANVHIKPLGIYSRKLKSLDELTAGEVNVFDNNDRLSYI